MKTDKRVRYTKMFLKEALIRLLQDKPISRITVKELCEKAEINRATFYSHYQDQYALLEQTEKELADNLVSYLNSLSIDPKVDNVLPIIREILNYIDANKELFRVLWGKNGDLNFQEQMIQILKESFISLLEIYVTTNSMENEFFYVYIINGCSGIIRKWLFEEYERVSIDELAELILLMATGIQPPGNIIS